MLKFTSFVAINPVRRIDARFSPFLSERRAYFSETNETVNKKVKAAHAHSLKPIMCVGEKLEERESTNLSLD